MFNNVIGLDNFNKYGFPEDVTAKKIIGGVAADLLGIGRLAEHPKDILISRVLSMTPFVGIYGTVVFLTTSNSLMGMINGSPQPIVRTFQNHKTEIQTTYYDHKIIGSKPATEHQNDELDRHRLEINLNSRFGVDPETEMLRLKLMLTSKKPYSLFLYGRYWGEFTLRTINCERDKWLGGRPALSKIEIDIFEYNDFLTTETQSIINEQARFESNDNVGQSKLQGANKPVENVPTRKFDAINRVFL